MSEKSPERLELEQEAEKLGISFKHNISDEKLMERVIAAQEAPEAALGGETAPEPPAPEPEAPAEDEPEKLSAEEVLHNKLTAYGVPEDQHKKTVPELEAQLRRVLAARAKAAEKRKQEDEGDYYGKVATIRITKKGDDKVGTGEYIAGIGNLCYAAGEIVPDIPLKTAEVLEDRGFAEIQ